jgi:hypothetical protein
MFRLLIMKKVLILYSEKYGTYKMNLFYIIGTMRRMKKNMST